MLKETLPGYLIEKLNFPSLAKALFAIHFPSDLKELERARLRLKFEELFFIQLNILKQKVNREKNFKGLVFSKVGEYLNTFYRDRLPFELTGAQKRVIKGDQEGYRFRPAIESSAAGRCWLRKNTGGPDEYAHCPR